MELARFQLVLYFRHLLTRKYRVISLLFKNQGPKPSPFTLIKKKLNKCLMSHTDFKKKLLTSKKYILRRVRKFY